MEIEAAIVSVLRAAAPLTALVGSRVYAMQEGQNPTRPFVTYYQTGGQPYRALSRRLATRSYRLRLEVYASTYAQGKAVRRALEDALLDLRGAIADGSVHVQAVTLDDAEDAAEAPPPGAELGDYVEGLDLSLSYSPLP